MDNKESIPFQSLTQPQTFGIKLGMNLLSFQSKWPQRKCDLKL